MADDNVWKRQAMANRWKADNKAESPRDTPQNNSPINQFLKNNQGTTPSPPWAKGGPATSQPQPPWVKNNPSPPNAQPPLTQGTVNRQDSQTNQPREEANKPAWAKGGSTGQPPWGKNSSSQEQGRPSQTSGQGPSWAKGNGASNPPWANKNAANQPPWAKVGQQVESKGSSLPWVKGSENSQSNESLDVSKNSWKLRQNTEIEKKKEMLQEEIRKQEEEERQKKRLEKERKDKEKQQQDTARELALMTAEDQLSLQAELIFREQQEAERQRQQAEEQARARAEQEAREKAEEQARVKAEEEARIKAEAEAKEKRQEEERAKRESQHSSRKQKGSSGEKGVRRRNPLFRGKKREMSESSKISHISSIKGFDNVNGVSEQEPSIPQKAYHRYLRLINEEVMESDYKRKIEVQKNLYQVQLQARRDCQSEIIRLFASKKVTNRRRKVIFSNSMQIQYALVEGRQAEQGIEFYEEEVQELRERFLHYEVLTRCVTALLKKKVNLHLRLPLLNFAQHKGVSFLVEHLCQQLADIIEIEIGLFPEIANEVLIFEKELELAYQQEHLSPLTKDQLMAKKVSLFAEDYYILYLRSDWAKNKKADPNSARNALTQLNHLNHLNVLQYLLGQPSILPYYRPPIEVPRAVFEQLEKTASPALKQILRNLSLARALSLVYSSCQGQVEEESFFRLVMSGNTAIWDMVSSAGSPDRETPTALALAALQKLSSVRFRFVPRMGLGKEDLVLSAEPQVWIQRLDLQLFEFVKNLDKYIEQDKEDLAEQSMNLLRGLWDELTQGQEASFSFLKLKSEVSYLLYRQREAQALELIDQAVQTTGKFSLQSIPVFLLSLKFYVVKDLELPLLQSLSEVLPTLEFYFGAESMIHALVYAAVASYYSKKGQEEGSKTLPSKVVTFFQHALSITVRLYGQKSLEVADIYLNRATAFANLQQFQLFEKDIQQALKTYKAHSKCNLKIAECHRLLGRVKCQTGEVDQGLELMELSVKQLIKSSNYLESLWTLFEMLPFLEFREADLEMRIERIVEVCFTYKAIWAFRRIATMVLDRELNCYTSLTTQHLHDLFHPLDPDDRTPEEVLIDLEQEIKGFMSFIEVVRWALSIIAGKLAARREASADYEKAHRIVREIFSFYGRGHSVLMESKELNSQLL